MEHDWSDIMGPTFDFFGWSRACFGCGQTQKVTMSGREAVGEHHTPADLFTIFAPTECEDNLTETQRLSVKFIYGGLTDEERRAIAQRLSAKLFAGSLA